MNAKTIAYVVCGLMAAGALLPAAQAAHYTLYNNGMHEEFGVFENAVQIDDANNRNGPLVDDKRPVPSESDVPARFRGLSDILRPGVANPLAGGTGSMILDHHMYGSNVEQGHVIPYGYYVSNAGGQPRTTPTSMHALWLGYWDDKSNDGIVDEFDCETGPANVCGAADEWTWRGANSGESLQANAWFLPGDYDGSVGTGAHVEPSAFGGDCTLYASDNAGCVSPGKDMPYADSTAHTDPNNRNNKRWAGNNGGGQWTPEEFLVVSQHVITVVGSDSLIENSDYGYRVDCTFATHGCLRDYDWYQALAGEAVDNLYLSTARSGARDSVWVPVEIVQFQLIAAPCPWSPAEVCGHDTRHLDAQGDGASIQKAYATIGMVSVVGCLCGTPPMEVGPDDPTTPEPDALLVLGAQGFYGDALVAGRVGNPMANALAGAFFRPAMTAWLWDDKDDDGYIGTPRADERDLYEMGLASTPNNGACERGSGNRFCELIGRADVYTATVTITAAGGWPPGSQLFRHYESGQWQVLETGNTGAWFTPLSGAAPAVLESDPERCKTGFFTCRTLDAVFVPSGSAAALQGRYGGGTVLVDWTEGVSSYDASFSGLFTSAVDVSP